MKFRIKKRLVHLNLYYTFLKLTIKLINNVQNNNLTLSLSKSYGIT